MSAAVWTSFPDEDPLSPRGDPSFPHEDPCCPRVDASIRCVPATYASVQTLIRSVPTMIRAVPASSAGPRASSAERKSKAAPVPAVAQEASGKRVSGLASIKRERRTPNAFPLEIRYVRRRLRWRIPGDPGDDTLVRAFVPARAITGQKTAAPAPSAPCYCTPCARTLFV